MNNISDGFNSTVSINPDHIKLRLVMWDSMHISVDNYQPINTPDHVSRKECLTMFSNQQQNKARVYTYQGYGQDKVNSVNMPTL